MLFQVIYLGCIGGKDVKDATRKVLGHVFATSLSRQLNFVGNGEKKGIMGMMIRHVIIGRL